MTSRIGRIIGTVEGRLSSRGYQRSNTTSGDKKNERERSEEKRKEKKRREKKRKRTEQKRTKRGALET